jgi:hypothetical protein
MASHSKGVKKDKFCALRKDKCPCGNEYQEVCKPASWATEFFLQGRKMRVEKYYEAHHLLCVACVTQFIAKKREIAPIVRQTQWCINTKKNMHAMPLWGHTIKHYCTLASGINILDRIRSRVRAPKFKNIPHHDYNHNSAGGYKSEVDTELKDVAKQIQKNKSKHKAAVRSLRGRLNSLSSDFRSRLRKRGKRCGGTHAAWLKGKKDPTSDWYQPFSMADDGCVEPRTFPGAAGDTMLEDKIKALVKAFGRWG